MRYIGLDLGTKTLGISLSSGIIATNFETLHHNEEYEKISDQVANIIKEKNIDVIVLGLPKNMNGTLGESAERCLKFKELLEKKTNKEVIMEDERLTSVVANNFMIKQDLSRKKRKEKVDGMAATVILQSYLDRRGN